MEHKIYRGEYSDQPRPHHEYSDGVHIHIEYCKYPHPAFVLCRLTAAEAHQLNCEPPDLKLSFSYYTSIFYKQMIRI